MSLPFLNVIAVEKLTAEVSKSNRQNHKHHSVATTQSTTKPVIKDNNKKHKKQLIDPHVNCAPSSTATTDILKAGCYRQLQLDAVNNIDSGTQHQQFVTHLHHQCRIAGKSINSKAADVTPLHTDSSMVTADSSEIQNNSKQSQVQVQQHQELSEKQNLPPKQKQTKVMFAAQQSQLQYGQQAALVEPTSTTQQQQQILQQRKDAMQLPERFTTDRGSPIGALTRETSVVMAPLSSADPSQISSVSLRGPEEVFGTHSLFKLIRSDEKLPRGRNILDSGNVVPTSATTYEDDNKASSSGDSVAHSTSGAGTKLVMGNLNTIMTTKHSTVALSCLKNNQINPAISAAGQSQCQQQHKPVSQTAGYINSKNSSQLVVVNPSSVDLGGGGSNMVIMSTQSSNALDGVMANGTKNQPKFGLSGACKSTNKQMSHQSPVSRAAGFVPKVDSPQPVKPVVQKMSLQRNMQFLTRVHALPQPVLVSQPSENIQQPQMVVQPGLNQRYVASTVTTTMPSGSTGSKSGVNMIKRAHCGMKISQAKNIGGNNIKHQQTSKTLLANQQSYTPSGGVSVGSSSLNSGGFSNNKVKSKLVKQLHATTFGSNVSSITIATLPPHQSQPPTHGSNTYTITQKVHAPLQSSATVTKITKLSSNGNANKNIVHSNPNHQQQQRASIASVISQGTQLQHRLVGQQQHSNDNTNNFTVQPASQHGKSAIGSAIVATDSPAGLIKFVNAHGTVMQQQPNVTPTSSALLQQQLHSQKITTNCAVVQRQQNHHNFQIHQQSPTQHQLHFIEAPVSAAVCSQNQSIDNTVRMVDGSCDSAKKQNGERSIIPSSIAGTQSLIDHTPSVLTEDVVIVNGTQMTDELSARILQSMAQKSFNSNQTRFQYQQPHKKTIGVVTAPHPQQLFVNQQAGLGGPTTATSSSLSSVTLSPKEYPFYLPVTASLQQQQQARGTNHLKTSSFNPVVAMNDPAAILESGTVESLAALGFSSHVADNTVAMSTGAKSTTVPHSVRQFHSTASNRSIDRKLYETTNRRSTEGFKIHNTANGMMNINEALPVNLIQNDTADTVEQVSIGRNMTAYGGKLQPSPIECGNGLSENCKENANLLPSTSDDVIGEEIRPQPVITEDVRLQILHAIFQDHTYANTVPSIRTSNSGALVQQITSSTISSKQSPRNISNSWKERSNCTSATQDIWCLAGAKMIPLTDDADQSNNEKVAHIYAKAVSMPQEDDARSNVSYESHIAVGDMDPGEETETAAEAEAEDDSVTRCICDLTHDDGYMICCDRCFAWQHVDCMGIDRQNIPDEYLCESCQPRDIDRVRARSLQILKRKEQHTQMMYMAQSATQVNNGSIATDDSVGAQRPLVPSTDSPFNCSYISAEHYFTPGSARVLCDSTTLLNGGVKRKSRVVKKSKDIVSKKARKSDKVATPSAVGTSFGGNATSKILRKETKKASKRKSKNVDGFSGVTAAERHALNLRQWIENYELAVTNHYSPELRARLHAITKQPSLLQSILNTENKALKDCGSLENRATTVPHAGGKILISNLDIGPNCPILELRGKYMLTTQYKTQNPSINMNTPPPSNYLVSYKAHRTPGPFIFFYQLPGMESPMQTMMADGTCPPQHPQPPSYLKGPEVCVDTRTYGNEARFVRRSCRPNAEVQHSFEKGTIHLFIVSLTDIRASTEITIRHEPHDLLAVANRKSFSTVIQSTSTTPCACGPVKDCLLGMPVQQHSNVSNVTLSQKFNRKAVVHNGNSGAQFVSGDSAGRDSTLYPSVVGLKKKSQTINRNRSTSSSGDSHIGWNSPSQLQVMQNSTGGNMKNVLPPSSVCSSSLMSNISSISSALHDSGICTSSSSPSVSLPSPTSQIHSPIQQHLSQIPCVQRSIMQQNEVQQKQVLSLLSTPMLIVSPQLQHQQPLTIIAATAAELAPLQTLTATSTLSCAAVEGEDKEKLYVPPHSQSPTHPKQDIAVESQQSVVELASSITTETALAAAALQTLNSSGSNSLNIGPLSLAVTDNALQQLESQAVGTRTEELEQTAVTHTQNVCQKSPSKNICLDEDKLCTGNIAVVITPTNTVTDHSVSPLPNTCNDTATGPCAAGIVPPVVNATSTPKETTQPKSVEKPKLSREDRKMEAILRAIEKMERNQQRKLEQKQAKTGLKQQQSSLYTGKQRSDTINSSTEGQEASGGNSHNKKNTPLSRKKKRKSHRSYSMHSTQRKRRKSRLIDSNDSDADTMVTSESDAYSVLSPPIQTTAVTGNICCTTLSVGGRTPPGTYNSETCNANQAAGLLMEFANTELTNRTPDEPVNVHALPMDFFKSPQRQMCASEEAVSSPSTPAPVSSACLLIEAAVGRLEQLEHEEDSSPPPDIEFKYPAKSKTKKPLSDWLKEGDVTAAISTRRNLYPSNDNTPEQSESDNQCSSIGLDSLVRASMSDYREQQEQKDQHGIGSKLVSDMQFSVPEKDIPQNLSILAKKVEEFINQTESSSSPIEAVATGPRDMDEDRSYFTNDKYSCSYGSRNMSLPIQVSTCSNNSSVKKRWLRQAISEETDENSFSIVTTTASSTISPTSQSATGQQLNCLSTPLKKRRLLLNCKGTGESFEVAQPSAPHLDVQDLDHTDSHVKSTHNYLNGSNAETDHSSSSDVSAVNEVRVHSKTMSKLVEIDNKLSAEANLLPTDSTPLPMSEQEDEIDIMRSPSPGEKIVAEDNLVKIEPEDATGDYDLKIDVEREESLPGEKSQECEHTQQIKKEEDCSDEVKNTLSSNFLGIKINAFKPETFEKYTSPAKFNNESKTKCKLEIGVDDITDLENVKKDVKIGCDTKDLNLEHSLVCPTVESQSLLQVDSLAKKEITEEISLATNSNKADAESTKSTVSSDAITANSKHPVTAQAPSSSLQKSLSEYMCPGSSALTLSSSAVSTAAANVLATSNSSTGLYCGPDGINNSSNVNNLPQSIRKCYNDRKNLSDDDIQERLHSFHKENILFLQSRNKKSKSNSMSAPNVSFTNADGSSKPGDCIEPKTGMSKHKSSLNMCFSTANSIKSHKKERNIADGNNKSHVKLDTASATPVNRKSKVFTHLSSSSQSSSGSMVTPSVNATLVVCEETNERQRTPGRSRKRQKNFGEELTKGPYVDGAGESILNNDKHRREGGRHSKDAYNGSSKDIGISRKRQESLSLGTRDDNSSHKNSNSCHKFLVSGEITSTAIGDKKLKELNESNTPSLVDVTVTTHPEMGTTHVTVDPIEKKELSSDLLNQQNATSHSDSFEAATKYCGNIHSQSNVHSLPTHNFTNTELSTSAQSAVHNQLPFYNTVYRKLLDNVSMEPASAIFSKSEQSTETKVGIPISDSSSAAGSQPQATSVTMLKHTVDVSSKTTRADNAATFPKSNYTCSVAASPVDVEMGITNSPLVSNIGRNNSFVNADLATSMAVPHSDSIAVSSVLVSAMPVKIVTKTACHDPRLNPILSAPEPVPAPKRKLSINEYRKRMQQSTDSANPSVCASIMDDKLSTKLGKRNSDTAISEESNEASIKYSFPVPSSQCGAPHAVENSALFGDLSLFPSTEYSSSRNQLGCRSGMRNYIGDDKTKGQFNAAPTLLEKQQEKMCERLKTLKSQQFVADLVACSAVADKSSLNKLNIHQSIFNGPTSVSITDLDNCLEAISSSSTSIVSSRESSPDTWMKNCSRKNAVQTDIYHKSVTVGVLPSYTEESNTINTNAVTESLLDQKITVINGTTVGSSVTKASPILLDSA